MDFDVEAFYEVERLVRMKIKKGQYWFYVKWKGYPMEQCTWEPEQNLGNCAKDIQRLKNEQQKSQSKGKSKSKKKSGKTNVEKLCAFYTQNNKPTASQSQFSNKTKQLPKKKTTSEERVKRSVIILSQIKDKNNEVSFLVSMPSEIVEMSKKKAILLFPDQVCLFYQERVENIIFDKQHR